MTTDMTTRDEAGNELAVYRPPDFLAVLEENLGPGASLSLGLLVRVQVPNDRESFEVDFGDGKEPVRTIKGVIAHRQTNRRYYRSAYDPSDTDPPDCYSPDGVTGYGDNGTLTAKQDSGEFACATCPMNEWGSAQRDDGRESRGKACAERVDLYVLRERGVLPLVVGAPPTSIQGWRRYGLRLADREKPFYSVETEIGLEPGERSSVLTFRRVRDLDGESVERVAQYRAGVEAVVTADEARRARERAEE